MRFVLFSYLISLLPGFIQVVFLHNQEGDIAGKGTRFRPDYLENRKKHKFE
jgi:hypothetical protein